MRMGLSALNHHRKNYRFIDSDKCMHCNLNVREDVLHYALICPTYAAHRQELLQSLSALLPDDIQHLRLTTVLTVKKNLVKLLLSGINDEEKDIQIFQAFELFIKKTKRFI